MTLTTARSTIGLNTKATPTSTAVSGTVQVGSNNETQTFSNADVAYSLHAVIVGASDLVWSVNDADSTGSTAFTTGVAQVETATAAGTIGTSGNADVVVTAAGMTGSPKTINVAVTSGDTASVWAGKVRTALAADTDVSALFTVGGTTTSIVLTRKPTKTYTLGSQSTNLYAADDATLNISLDNGTCTGITTAGTSTNTTAGVLTVGTKIYDGDGNDFEGVALSTIAANQMCGLYIKNDENSASNVVIEGTDQLNTGTGGGITLKPDGMLAVSHGNEDGDESDDLTVGVASGSACVVITAIGVA